PINADIILSLKAQRKRQPKKLQEALDQGVELQRIKSNTLTQRKKFLREHFGESNQGERQGSYYGHVESALREAEDAVIQVQGSSRPASLSPQNSYIGPLQHELVQDHGLTSQSEGKAPFRRVVVQPQALS